jgi:AraC-like DNA-binding protein
VRPLSAVTKLLTLAIEPRDRDAAHREYRPHVDRARFAELLAHEAVLVRTRWFDELAHRYVFEIHDCEKHGSKAARFLETELTKELYFLAKEHVEQKTRASVLQEASDVVKRARAKIEAALFEPLSVEELARLCGTSASTLLRAFRREVGVAPATYARDRRLDEALLLLEAGKWTASEVATRVGYASLPAFTVAFRRRFGVVPSRARAAPSPTLPPQGEPLTKSRKPLTRSRK